MNNSTVETLIGAVVIVIAGAFLTFAYNTPGKSQKGSRDHDDHGPDKRFNR